MTIHAVAGPSRSISDRIALEELRPGRFRGRAHQGPATRTYGGEVAGQAVLAAHRTVSTDREIHSASMHFLLPGDTSVPLEFSVENTRDGRSFSVRHVEAHQYGRVIFTMTASFHCHERGLAHQTPTLNALPPSSLPTTEEMFAEDPGNLRWIRQLTSSVGVEARFPEIPARCAAARGQRTAPVQQVWLRAGQPVATPRAERAAAVAYISDLLLLSAALGPHELTLQGGELQFATISHTIWFHAPLAIDEWFLYDQDSRWAGAGRALCCGEMFDSAGTLCATTMQEGLLRLR